MADDNYYFVDPATGTKAYYGPSELTKGNHNNLPATDGSYLPTDERGHIQASSLGGSNKPENIAPQARDLNHGSWYNAEGAERDSLRSGNTIDSEKIAFSSNQPENRPDAFLLNDSIHFSDGQTQEVHLSFSNMQNSEQAEINEEAATQASDMMDAFHNPGDGLRDSMSPQEYAELMEQTDAALPSIGDHFAEWDYEGPAGMTAETGEAAADWDGGSAVASVDVGAGDPSADISGVDADGADCDGSDGGASSSASDED